MDLGPKRYTHLQSAKGVDPSGFFSLQDTDASSREPSTPGSTPKSGKMPKAHMLQDKGPGSREPENTRRFGLVDVCVDVSPRFQAGKFFKFQLFVFFLLLFLQGF